MPIAFLSAVWGQRLTDVSKYAHMGHIILYRSSSLLPYFDLLGYTCPSMKQGIKDAGHSEDSTDDGTCGRHEMVESLGALGHHNLDWRHIVGELGRGNEYLLLRLIHVAVHRVLISINVSVWQLPLWLHSRQHNLQINALTQSLLGFHYGNSCRGFEYVHIRDESRISYCAA